VIPINFNQIFYKGLSDIRDYSKSRIVDLKESNEIILFDVIEYLDCIIQK